MPEDVKQPNPTEGGNGVSESVAPGHGYLAMAFQLSSIGFAISERFRRTLEEFEIEPRDFFLLRTVGMNAGQSQRALAERLHIPTSSMVAAVDDLEERDLLERRVMPNDRRVRALHLTKKGRALMAKALPQAMAIENSIQEALGANDVATLFELLSRVGPIFGVVDGAAHSAMTNHE